MPFRQFSERGAAALERAAELARRSGAVTPAHLLAAVLEIPGPVAEVADLTHAPAGHHGEDAAGSVVHYNALARQAIESTAAWAARRRVKAGPEDLLIILLEQHSPSVVASLERARLDSARMRRVALGALGLPGDYGAVTLEPVPTSGMADGGILEIGELPAEAWEELELRQGRLPLRRVRRPWDWSAVTINEQRAVRKMASRRRLAELEIRSILHHHLRAVQRLGAEGAPDIVPAAARPAGGTGPGGAVTVENGRHQPSGWSVWLGNRRIGLKVMWFRWTAQRY